MKKITAKKIIIKPFATEDLNDPSYIKWLRDYDVIKTINRPEYFNGISFKQVSDYVSDLNKSTKDLFFSINCKKLNKFIGTCRISEIDQTNSTCNLGIMIGDKDFWGKGIATEVFFHLAFYAFESLEIRKVEANYMSMNKGMEKVFSKLGFKIEGILRKKHFFEGQYIDHVYVGCFRNELIHEKE